MHRPMKLSHGQQVALRRDALGWNQADLAQAVGVSLSTIVRTEGDDPRVSKAMKAAIWRAIEERERAVGSGPDLSTPPEITGHADDATAKLQTTRRRLAQMEGVLAEALDGVRRILADLADDTSDTRRKHG